MGTGSTGVGMGTGSTGVGKGMNKMLGSPLTITFLEKERKWFIAGKHSLHTWQELPLLERGKRNGVNPFSPLPPPPPPPPLLDLCYP